MMVSAGFLSMVVLIALALSTVSLVVLLVLLFRDAKRRQIW